MARIWSNFQAGTTTDAPLSNVATTINSAEFAALPAVSAPDILTITLDPDGRAGNPEIVEVTAHTASATSVTVTRGAESSTGRSHAAGTRWAHGVTAAALAAASGVVEGRLKASGTNPYYSIPGVIPTSQSTGSVAVNVDSYMPFLVETTITLDRLAGEVTTAGAAGKVARFGIYNADTDWQPTTLVLDAGTVPVDTTGVKTITINQQLTPGRYLFVINTDGSPSFRIIRGLLTRGIFSGMGTSPFTDSMTVVRTYAAFPSTGTPWDTALAGNQGGFPYSIVARVSTP